MIQQRRLKRGATAFWRCGSDPSLKPQTSLLRMTATAGQGFDAGAWDGGYGAAPPECAGT